MKTVSIQEAKTHLSQLLAHMQENACVLICAHQLLILTPDPLIQQYAVQVLW